MELAKNGVWVGVKGDKIVGYTYTNSEANSYLNSGIVDTFYYQPLDTNKFGAIIPHMSKVKER